MGLAETLSALAWLIQNDALLFGAVLVVVAATSPSSGLLTGLVIMAAYVNYTLFAFRFGDANSSAYIDVAASYPQLSVMAMTVLVLLATTGRGRPKVPGRLALLVAVVLLLTGPLLWWPPTGKVWAGTFHFAVSLLAFPLGFRIATRPRKPSDGMTLATMICLTLVCEIAVEIRDLVTGVGLAGITVTNRARGTLLFSPNLLAATLVLTLFLLLPLLRDPDRRVVRRAALASVLCMMAEALTASRAGIIACALMIVTGLVFSPKVLSGPGRLAQRGRLVRVLVLAPLVVVATVPLRQRFPDGWSEGGRLWLLEDAAAGLGDWWLLGTGPNRWVEAFGAVSGRIAQRGAPVHNAPILLLEELGLVLAVACLWPLGRVAVTAWRARKSGARATVVWAESCIAATVAVGFLMMVDWALLQDPVMAFLYFVFGYGAGQLATARMDGALDPAESLPELARL